MTSGSVTVGAPLAPLVDVVRADPAVDAVAGLGHGTLAVAGPGQAPVLAALAGRRSATLLVVTATLADAERLVDDLHCFLSVQEGSGDRVLGACRDAVVLLPPWETLLFERVSPSVSTMGLRLAVLWQLLEAPVSPRVVVAPVRAMLQRLVPLEDAMGPVVVRVGERLDQETLVEDLVRAGYVRELQAEHRGELAVRGGIVDVFPSSAEVPVRIDLWGDEVERLTAFDVADQRSVADLEEVVLFGARELRVTDKVAALAEELVATEPWGREQWGRLARGEQFEGMESWLPWVHPDEVLLTDRLKPGTQVVIVEPRRVRDRASELVEEERALGDTLAETWGFSDTTRPVPRMHLPYQRLLERSDAPVISMVPAADGPGVATVTVRAPERVAGDAARLAETVARGTAEGGSVVLCATTEGGASRLSAVLADAGVHAPVLPSGPGTPGPGADARVGSRRRAFVVVAPLSRGFVLPERPLTVLAEADVTGRRAPHRQARPRARPVAGFFQDLAPGSYVVHRQHGIARYAGVTTRTLAGTARDYLVLEFRGDDRLYLPVDQIEAITPYGGGESPTLSRMGGADWQRARARARAAAAEVAADLVALYRTRLQATGHAFSADTPWQRELEDAFPYAETADQLRAVAEMKADMEDLRPMDRLVCGDVGFGKTEVAVRAVFKAVQDGKQAAVLVPTTLLASQHFQTFTERFAGFPVRVELLSRFLTAPEVRAVRAGLAEGTVDVVIGTHRLLGADVVFKDLGLLVVDEEQRFGVSHKEAVKRLTDGVDVLTLTASPIPRTLEMALTGIRDLSMISTPPADRRPILTYVGEQDDAAVSEALRRELLREGQVFFVHNRVADIDAVAEHLRHLVPEARVAVAHGQMDEGTLERVAQAFFDRELDVLVCTTIIESGIDMPTVNTLVVDRADLLGLGQLHQIRGRVGRGDQRAYAYLLHPRDRVLTEQAYERLKTIGERTELGSGFAIAMRDLEIRGAGNLLGSSQSGHIAAVGYDLYVQLVAEAVAEARGERRPVPPTVSVDVPGDARLPSAYVPGEDMRLDAYRRLAATTTLAEVEDVAAEWLDRFGPLPAAAQGLLWLGRLRARALEIGISEISVAPARPGGRSRPVAKLSPAHLAPSAQVRLRRLVPDGRYREELELLELPLEGEAPPAQQLLSLIDALWPPP